MGFNKLSRHAKGRWIAVAGGVVNSIIMLVLVHGFNLPSLPTFLVVFVITMIWAAAIGWWFA